MSLSDFNNGAKAVALTDCLDTCHAKQTRLKRVIEATRTLNDTSIQSEDVIR